MRGLLRPAALLFAAMSVAAVVGPLGAGSAAAQQPQIVGHPAATATVTFDVYLPLRNSAALDALLAAQQRVGSSQYHRWLTPAGFAARFGADPGEVARITASLQSAGLTVQASGSHSLRVSGPVATVEKLFATRLATGRFADGHVRLVAETAMTTPGALAGTGAVVAQFLPVEHMHADAQVVGHAPPPNRYGPTGPYWFDDLKQAYHFPSYALANGQGATIGILTANDYLASDMTTYFGNEQLAPPTITEEMVFGGAPFDPVLSKETTLDIQQAGGMAPLAAIKVYNLPNLSDEALLAGLTAIDEDNDVDLVNMSFGSAEPLYTAPYNAGLDLTGILAVYDDLFRQGSAQGITFVAATGDLGAYAVPNAACFAPGATAACGGYVLSVNLPASDPNVTAVGGTNLVTTSPDGAASLYAAENAHPDPLALDVFYGTPARHGLYGSGGGVSTVFPQPSYQAGVSPLSSSFRIVPDVAFHMGGCPAGCGDRRAGPTAAPTSRC